MKENTGNIGIVLLAAGASKRLGKPKQLLRFRGETLLRRSVKIALDSACRPVVVVLGANAEKLKSEIEEFDVEITENPGWENGMGTSIQTGVQTLSNKNLNVDGVILMTCDQPFVSVDLIEQMLTAFRLANAPIIASTYGETIGVPALFSRRFFPELLELKADNGAKKIIYKYRQEVVEILFEAGLIDVDTEQDYLNLIKPEDKNPENY